MLIEAIRTVIGTFPFAVGFGTRRRDYLLGTLAWGVAVCAAWAILLGLLSLIEANVIKNWGVGLHFFHLPFFSDGSPLRQFCWSYYHDMSCAQSDPNYLSGGSPLGQFWVYFVLLLFLYLLGLLLGSIYQCFGRMGEYVFFGIAFLLLSVFFLVSTYWHWWGAIFGWLVPADRSSARFVAGAADCVLCLRVLCAAAQSNRVTGKQEHLRHASSSGLMFFSRKDLIS